METITRIGASAAIQHACTRFADLVRMNQRNTGHSSNTVHAVNHGIWRLSVCEPRNKYTTLRPEITAPDIASQNAATFVLLIAEQIAAATSPDGAAPKATSRIAAVPPSREKPPLHARIIFFIWRTSNALAPASKWKEKDHEIEELMAGC